MTACVTKSGRLLKFQLDSDGFVFCETSEQDDEIDRLVSRINSAIIDLPMKKKMDKVMSICKTFDNDCSNSEGSEDGDDSEGSEDDDQVENVRGEFEFDNDSDCDSNVIKADETSRPTSNSAHLARLTRTRMKTNSVEAVVACELMALQSDIEHKKTLGVEVQLQDDSDLMRWTVRLSDFDPQTMLAQSMKAHNVEYIELAVVFSSEFPMVAPFVYVTWPRFQPLTGHVMNGGAVCCSILATHWLPTYSIDNLLQAIRSTLLMGNGKIADAKTRPAYTEKSARASYQDILRAHAHDW